MPDLNGFAIWIGTSLLGGLAAHAAVVAWTRRSYSMLRHDYTLAVAETQGAVSADAIVHAEELQRAFARAAVPGWWAGLTSHLKSAFLVSGVLGGALLVLAGRLPPAFVVLALVLLLGLRRILVASALLLLAFVVSSLLSTPRPQDRSPAPVVSSGVNSHRGPARSP